jgi:hypothetical protein
MFSSQLAAAVCSTVAGVGVWRVDRVFILKWRREMNCRSGSAFAEMLRPTGKDTTREKKNDRSWRKSEWFFMHNGCKIIAKRLQNVCKKLVGGGLTWREYLLFSI